MPSASSFSSLAVHGLCLSWGNQETVSETGSWSLVCRLLALQAEIQALQGRLSKKEGQAASVLRSKKAAADRRDLIEHTLGPLQRELDKVNLLLSGDSYSGC